MRAGSIVSGDGGVSRAAGPRITCTDPCDSVDAALRGDDAFAPAFPAFNGARSYSKLDGMPLTTSSMLARRCGSIVSRSAMSGMSARARVTSATSMLTDRIASSHNGARPNTSPCAPDTNDPPGKTLPPSLPTSVVSATKTPCSSAISRISRSQRLVLAGPGTSSVLGHGPRAGGAAHTKMTCAPSNAAIVAVMLCQASSHTSIAARPHDVSNARTVRPRSTNRSSSNNPYVGRNTLR